MCDRLGVFTEKTARASNDLLFYVVTPCVIIDSFFSTKFTPESAKSLLIAALGGTPVKYPFRNECCGAYVKLVNPDLTERKSKKVLENAKENGAEIVITACPLCYYNLKQTPCEDMEVVYFTELLAEALGVKD